MNEFNTSNHVLNGPYKHLFVGDDPITVNARNYAIEFESAYNAHIKARNINKTTIPVSKIFVPISCTKCFAYIKGGHYHVKGKFEGTYCERCVKSMEEFYTNIEEFGLKKKGNVPTCKEYCGFNLTPEEFEKAGVFWHPGDE